MYSIRVKIENGFIVTCEIENKYTDKKGED